MLAAAITFSAAAPRKNDAIKSLIIVGCGVLRLMRGGYTHGSPRRGASNFFSRACAHRYLHRYVACVGEDAHQQVARR